MERKTIMPRILFIAIAAVVFAAAVVGWRHLLTSNNAAPGQTQAIAIGGPFTLTDMTGKTVTDQDFRGKHMLIYFGYTFCPDVCPTSLGIIGQALDQLSPEQLDKVQPIFISVDPARDTPEVLATYVVHFHEKIIGMMGTDEQTKAVAKAYKAYYAKSGEGEDYTMDHSSITYLMGPDGNFVLHFNHGTPADEMAAKLKDAL